MIDALVKLRIEQHAKSLTHRAPWMYDRVLGMLKEHHDKWNQQVADMERVAESPLGTEKVHQIGYQSVAQILAAGDLLDRRIQTLIAHALATQEGKPKSNQWSPEQLKEGKHKRELLEASSRTPEGVKKPRIPENGYLPLHHIGELKNGLSTALKLAIGGSPS